MGNETSVQWLPHVDVRQGVRYASNKEIDAAGLHRIENVFFFGEESRPGLAFYCQISS